MKRKFLTTVWVFCLLAGSHAYATEHDQDVTKASIVFIFADDLLPTFCENAGAELPEGYQPDGKSQLATLRWSEVSKRDSSCSGRGYQIEIVSRSTRSWMGNGNC